MKRQQSGFTLVEIAIVMVIIGLLLGGVLKGQEVITNARIKNVNNDFSGVSAAIYSYQDRYAALPGDDISADAHVGVLAANVGDGDGLYGDTFDAAAAGGGGGVVESRLAWLHLRAAGLVSGVETDESQPSNAFNGITGISTGDNGGGENVNGITGLHIGFTQVEGAMAVILDTQNDDGNGNTGTIRATVTGDLNGDGTYVQDTVYSQIFEL